MRGRGFGRPTAGWPPELTLRYWIAEREEIRRRREAGKPWPWTDDPILKDNRFCNVSRRFDKMTLVLGAHLGGLAGDYRSTLLSITLFRAFNRLATWDALKDMSTTGLWDHRAARKRLRAMAARGEKLCSGVWMTAGAKGVPAYESQLEAAQHAWLNTSATGLPASLTGAYKFFTDLPMVGPFVGNEMVMDLAYLTQFLSGAPDRGTYIRLGPGAVRGLRRLRRVEVPSGLEQPKATDEDWEEFWRLCKSLKKKPPCREALSIHDVEHVLCEADKYSRGMEGGHLKNRYRPPAAD
jgi:hypothetical protein